MRTAREERDRLKTESHENAKTFKSLFKFLIIIFAILFSVIIRLEHYSFNQGKLFISELFEISFLEIVMLTLISLTLIILYDRLYRE